jgi:superfamily II DNA or RNA helicase
MSLIISAQIGLKTIVMIQNSTLLGQWKKEVTKFTNCTSWIVGEEPYVAGGPDFIICLNTSARTRLIDKITRSTIGFMIIDECPLHCNQQGIEAILDFCPRYILALSGTPSRSRDGLFSVMESVIGKGCNIKTDVKIEFDVCDFQTGVAGVRDNSTTFYKKLVQSLMYNDYRNQLIVRLCAFFIKEGHKIILLTEEKNHVEALGMALSKTNMTYDTFYGNKKTYNNAQILIAIIKKASVGFDEAGEACIGFDGVRISCVILCSSLASPENIIQSAGRSWRSTKKRPIVVHMVDDDSIIEGHYTKAKKAYRSTENYKPNFLGTLRLQ